MQSHNFVLITDSYSHIMIDLILVDEDTGIFGNEVSIQGNVSCGT